MYKYKDTFYTYLNIDILIILYTYYFKSLNFVITK